jgi:predicted lysophospholipase L1 biosynthesis ABC-type transport system permease subunit
VVVISESMAKQYWPKGDALGARIHMGPDQTTPVEVIGIVGDVRNDPVRQQREPIAYGSARQFPWGSVSVLLRAEGSPLALASAVRRQLAAIDPTLPLDHVTSLQSLVGTRFDVRRLPVVLMTSFGLVALVLASVGVYALFASMTAARQREFSVRVALGSSPAAIAALVVRQGIVWLALGLVGGLAGVAVVGRFVAGLLYGVKPFDPLTLGATLATIVVCAMIALLAPVRRATRADATAELH